MAKKILLVTDPTRDVDDVVLFAVLMQLQRLGLTEVVGVVVTYMIPELRARVMRLMCKMFGVDHQMVGMGSEFPLGRVGDQALLHQYLEEHRLYGHSYEGLGLEGLDRLGFAIFRQPEEVILNAVEDNQDELYIFIVAPCTDLAKAILHNRGVFERGNVQGVYVQGSALWNEQRQRLVPDPDAFNLEKDMWAAEIVFEQLMGLGIPFTFLGKWAAYEAPMTEVEFRQFADTEHPVGKYLYEAAKNGLTCFAHREPELYSRLYANGSPVDPDDPIKDATHWSNPYDPTTALALVYPQMFVPERVGQHTLIGVDKGNPGVVDANALKQSVLNTVLQSLQVWTVGGEQVA